MRPDVNHVWQVKVMSRNVTHTFPDWLRSQIDLNDTFVRSVESRSLFITWHYNANIYGVRSGGTTDRRKVLKNTDTYTIPSETIVEGFAFDHPRHVTLDIMKMARRCRTCKHSSQNRMYKPHCTFRATVPSSAVSGSETTKHLEQHR